MTLDPTDEHGLVYVMVKGGTPHLPEEYIRILDMKDHIHHFVENQLADFDAHHFLNVYKISDTFFQLMLEGGAIKHRIEPIVGEYVKFDKEYYVIFRTNSLSNNGIYAASRAIGERYFTDAFEAISEAVTADYPSVPPDLDEHGSVAEEISSGDFDRNALSTSASREIFSELTINAEREVEASGLSNEGKSSANGYLVAIRALANVPEPPADLIWSIIVRASAITSIASFFLAILAFFTVG